VSLTVPGSGKFLYRLSRVNSIQTQNDFPSTCRWNLNDATKVFFAYLALMFVGLPVAVRLLRVLFGFHAQNNTDLRMISLYASLFINLSICCVVYYIVCIKYRHSITALGLSLVDMSHNVKQGVKRYLITLPLIILAGYVVNIVFSYYGITPEMQDVIQWVLDEKSSFVLVCLMFFGTIIAPIIEEILFRGFLLPALKKSLGGRYAIVVSAALFAAVHIDIFAFLQIFILGLLLGHLYEKTKTLTASIMVHITHNVLTLLFLLYLKYFLDGKMPIF